jgi:hypothetical protein
MSNNDKKLNSGAEAPSDGSFCLTSKMSHEDDHRNWLHRFVRLSFLSIHSIFDPLYCEIIERTPEEEAKARAQIMRQFPHADPNLICLNKNDYHRAFPWVRKIFWTRPVSKS